MYINLSKVQVNGTNYLTTSSGFKCSITFPVKPRPYVLNIGQDIAYVVNITCNPVNPSWYEKIIANVTIDMGCGITYKYLNLSGTVIYIH